MIRIPTARLCRADVAVVIGSLLSVVLLAACGRVGYAASPATTFAGRAAGEATQLPATQAAADAPAAAGSQVTIAGFSFGPPTVAVSAGSTVSWTNNDAITHTVTETDSSFDSSNLEPNQQFSFTFAVPGTYLYHCSVHPFMTGTIVVQ